MDNTKENHSKSVELWIESQGININTLKLNIEYLKNEIKLKTKQLKNAEESLEHEIIFTDEYLKSIDYKK